MQKVILQVTLCGEFFVFLQQNERDNSSASGQPTTEQKAMPGFVISSSGDYLFINIM